MKQKRPFTLMEIMIVIFLIGIIGGAISYNMRGSMEKGRVFKTEQAMRQLIDILELAISDGAEVTDVIDKPVDYLKRSGMVKNPDKLLKDGWNKPFKFEQDSDNPGQIRVVSDSYMAYKEKQKALGVSTSNDPNEDK